MDSRTTAIVNQSGLPLTPRKQESSRVLHEVLSRQQFHFRRASKHRVLDRSAEPHRRIHQRRDAVLHTDLTGDSTDAGCTMRSVASRGVRRVATECKPKRKCHVSFENTAATAATTAVHCHVQADGLSLPDTLSTGSRSRRGAGRHTTVTVKTTTTAHVRQQPPAQPRKPRAKELAL